MGVSAPLPRAEVKDSHLMGILHQLASDSGVVSGKYLTSLVTSAFGGGGARAGAQSLPREQCTEG